MVRVVQLRGLVSFPVLIMVEIQTASWHGWSMTFERRSTGRRNAVHPEWDILDILPPWETDIFDSMPLPNPDQGMGETTEIVHLVALPHDPSSALDSAS